MPLEKVPVFRKALVKYYEDESDNRTKYFLLDECFLPIQEKEELHSFTLIASCCKVHNY